MRDEAGRVVVFGVVAVMVLISWQRVRACGGWCLVDVDVLDSSLLKQMKEATDRKRIVSTIVFEIHQVRQRQEWCVVPRTLHVDCALSVKN